MARKKGSGGGSGDQQELPGVVDDVKKYPKLDRAMKHLLSTLDEFAKDEIDVKDAKRTVMELIHEHELESYSIKGLMVGTKETEERLYVKRLKEPAKKQESAA